MKKEKKRKPHLALVQQDSSQPAPSRKKRLPKPGDTPSRWHLLKQLRAESAQVSRGYFSRDAAPYLYDLAQAAKVARGNRVYFCGVRFPLRFGIWKYVIDPETGLPLVAASGGWL